MRIKRGVTKKQKHKKVLQNAKGYRLSYSKLYRRAKQNLLHAGAYSFAHRKRRRSQKRNEWVKVISAGLVGSGISYSKLIAGMKKNNVEIDRKNLAEMIVSNRGHFDKVVAVATK